MRTLSDVLTHISLFLYRSVCSCWRTGTARRRLLGGYNGSIVCTRTPTQNIVIKTTIPTNALTFFVYFIIPPSIFLKYHSSAQKISFDKLRTSARNPLSPMVSKLQL